MISRARSRHSRCGLVAIAFELLLGGAQITVTGTGAYFMIRGNMEWRDAQRELAAAGYSLKIEDLTRAAVPDAENFGATPALRGVLSSEREQLPGTKAKLARLQALNPLPNALRVNQKFKVPDETMTPPVDWKTWREWLANPLQWAVPEAETDDAKAVDAALAAREPELVGELRRAARRPRAQLLPRESQRLRDFAGSGELAPRSPQFSQLLLPYRFFLLQIEAGLAAGRQNAIADDLPVLISLAKLPRTESSWLGLLVSKTMDYPLGTAALEWMKSRRASAADLALIQNHLSGAYTARALRNGLNQELWLLVRLAGRMVEQGGDFSMFGMLMEQPELTPLEQARSAAVARVILPGNLARGVRHFLNNAEFLNRDDWAGLLAEAERFKADQERVPRLMRARTVFADGAYLGFSALFQKIAVREFRLRLLITACALERWRLEGKDMPDSLEDLPERLLPEVPRDIDGQPIRYRPAPEGFVVWSVGLNLEDDWHGAPPPDEARDQEPRDQADWQVRVP